MIKIIIADDDAIIREGLKMIIASQEDMEILGEAENGLAAITLCEKLSPDVCLLDIRMPVMDGIDAAEKILSENLSYPLLLTTFDEEDFVIRAMKIGACGYILKNSPAERILSAIRTVSMGGTVFGADILDYIRSRITKSNGINVDSKVFDLLSQRELDVVKLIAKGFSNQEIADSLFISHGTVRNYISTILEKTGLDHRTQIAVKFLTKSGITWFSTH